MPDPSVATGELGDVVLMAIVAFAFACTVSGVLLLVLWIRDQLDKRRDRRFTEHADQAAAVARHPSGSAPRVMTADELVLERLWDAS